MPPPPPTARFPRIALLAGATGLVGVELLVQLQASPAYSTVQALVRHPGQRPGTGPKLQFHTVDFARLPDRLPAVDDVYIALGTTIEAAGSKEVFARVDRDFVVATASAARQAGARRLAVVSAHGADPKSLVFYNRVKGEMEAAVAQLGYQTIVVAQPSLLLGNRNRLGQPRRRGEAWAQRLLGPIAPLIPKGIRPIAAAAVAEAMVRALQEGHAGVRYLSSARMQPR